MIRQFCIVGFFLKVIVIQAQTMCVTCTEFDSITVSAPSGNKFSSIIFASYGTPNGSCGSFTTSSCHSTNSSSVISSLAINQTSFTVNASNAVFGDSCIGTLKRLYIEVAYTAVLPIELLKLEAENYVDGNVLINWETVDEINASHFEIEQSFDGNTFNNIGFVLAKGSLSKYSFKENITLSDCRTRYYRLKMVDIDGEFVHSKIISWNCKHEINKCLVYPTIIDKYLTVECTDGNSILEYCIFDSFGTIIQVSSSKNNIINNIDLSNLTKGLYLVVVRLHDKIYANKIIKQ